jgi:hypothetical protein
MTGPGYSLPFPENFSAILERPEIRCKRGPPER